MFPWPFPLPKFVEYGGKQCFSPPHTLSDAEIFVFSLDADREILQNLFDKCLNDLTPSFEYRSLDQVLIVFHRVKALVPQDSKVAIEEEGEVTFFIPFIKIEKNFFQFALGTIERLLSKSSTVVGVFVPYIFLNSSPALITGREVYGYPKEWGDIKFPWQYMISTREKFDKIYYEILNEMEGKKDEFKSELGNKLKDELENDIESKFRNEERVNEDNASKLKEQLQKTFGEELKKNLKKKFDKELNQIKDNILKKHGEKNLSAGIEDFKLEIRGWQKKDGTSDKKHLLLRISRSKSESDQEIEKDIDEMFEDQLFKMIDKQIGKLLVDQSTHKLDNNFSEKIEEIFSKQFDDYFDTLFDELLDNLKLEPDEFKHEGDVVVSAKAIDRTRHLIESFAQSMDQEVMGMFPYLSKLFDLKVFESISKRVMSLALPTVFLKQFRDAKAGEDACYRGIVESEYVADKFQECKIFLTNPTDIDVEIKYLESHPIAQELGLKPKSREEPEVFQGKFWLWAKSDFRLEAGKIIRESGVSPFGQSRQ
ncbi:MAG: hypothetical protein AAGG51_00590 [Cyanobacteria bacterium P01_G01_bin.54]